MDNKNKNDFKKVLFKDKNDTKEKKEIENLTSMAENEFVDISNIKQWDPKTIPENFFILISAKRRAGKSWLVRHLLKPIKDRFKHAYLFSETAHLQDPNPFDFIPDCNKFDHFDEEVIDQMLKNQNMIKEKNMKMKKSLQLPNPILIVLDDVISGPEIRKSRALKSLATQGRHSNVSVICLSQTISAKYGFPSVIRDNLDIFICFTLHSCFNRDTAAECFASIVDKREGIKLINSITQEKPYQVAVFDLSLTNVKRYEDYVFKYIAPDSLPKFMIGPKDDKHDKFITDTGDRLQAQVVFNIDASPLYPNFIGFKIENNKFK